MTAFLRALALRHYRGIGAKWQIMPAFTKFNFFIGANNSGKSTVLNFIAKYLPITLATASRPSQIKIDPLEVHRGGSGDGVEMAVGVPGERVLHDLMIALPENSRAQATPLAAKLIEGLGAAGLLWIGSKLPYRERLEFAFAKPSDELGAILSERDWNILWMNCTRQNGGGLKSHWIPETLEFVRKHIAVNLPDTRIIPAIRRVGKRDVKFGDYSGEGLIDRLAELQSPDHDSREDRVLFDQINGFVQEVTASPEARIEIPHNREHILVHMDNRVLPLSSLGTGIEEVIMIASFCTISSKEIVCIEEPEIHLHPILQRKLVRYLNDHTTNQYFVATHSPSFIDTPGAAVFHVRLQEGATTITEAQLKKERHAICVDLGVKASDIVQANCVIWVEGPSDRIYLKHWIRAVDEELEEGVHYSIMFYGGRLLSHLSADDDEVGEFIALRALNRHLAILIDSDKSAPQARLNATKTRLVEELTRDGGIAWVTKGREIENYVNHEELQSAVSEVYGDIYKSAVPAGNYDHALFFERSSARRGREEETADNIERQVDKVKVAKAVCAKQANLDVLDLRERVEQLVALIKSAND